MERFSPCGQFRSGQRTCFVLSKDFETQFADTKRAMKHLKISIEKAEKARSKELRVHKWGKLIPRPIGMVNLGNSCYINSILQTLIFTSPVFKELTDAYYSDAFRGAKKKFRISIELHIMMMVFTQCNKTPYSPKAFVDNQKEISSYFQYRHQQDAMECWTGIIDKLCEESPELESVLSGSFRVKIVCTKCGHEDIRSERFIDIALDLLEDGVTTVESSLNKYFSDEEIEDCICDKCANIGTRIKGIQIEKLPDILVFQAKRFILTEKNCGYLDYPQEFSMEKFVVKGDNDEFDMIYRLYSVVVHYGLSVNGGHYTAYVRVPDGEWYHFDDETVTVTTAEASYSAENPYILFYERKFMKPKPQSLLGKCYDRYRKVIKKWKGRFEEWRPLLLRVLSLVCLNILPQYCDNFLEPHFSVPFLQQVYLLCKDIESQLKHQPQSSSDGDRTKDIPKIATPSTGVQVNRALLPYKGSQKKGSPFFFTGTIPEIQEPTPVINETRPKILQAKPRFQGRKPIIPEIIVEDVTEVPDDIVVQEETAENDTSRTSSVGLQTAGTFRPYKGLQKKEPTFFFTGTIPEIQEPTPIINETKPKILPAKPSCQETTPIIPEIIVEDTSEVPKDIVVKKEATENDTSLTSLSISTVLSTDQSYTSDDFISATSSDETTDSSIKEEITTSLESSSTSDEICREHKSRSMVRRRLPVKKLRYIDGRISSNSSSGFFSDVLSGSSGISSSTSSDDKQDSSNSISSLSSNENNSNNGIKNGWARSFKGVIHSAFSTMLNTSMNIYNIYNSSVL